jgi:ketosteroid isomerase-like protein
VGSVDAGVGPSSNDAPPRPRAKDARVERVAAYFDAMASPADLARLPEIYADDAWFKDPFNQVQGRDAITRIFAHMYEQLDAPRFRMLDTVSEGDSAFFVWSFRFLRKGAKGTKGDPIVVVGCSHIRFAADGRVAYHRDYWDPAEGIYEKLPWIGGLFRWIRRQAGGQ